MDDGDSTIWLSYSEIASRRGIGRRSAIRLAQRRRWPRRRGNTGDVMVAVPATEAVKCDDVGDVVGDIAHDDAGDISHITKAFELALTTLREQLAAAYTDNIRMRQRADRAEERAQTAEVALAVERAARRSWLFRWRR